MNVLWFNFHTHLFYLFATIGISDKANILVSTISVHGKISQSIETITLSSQTLCPGSSITDKGMVVMMVSKTQTKKPTHQQPTDLFHEGALSSSPYLFFTAYHHSYHTTIVLVFGGFVLFCFLKELYFSKLKYSTGGKPLPATGEKHLIFTKLILFHSGTWSASVAYLHCSGDTLI